MVSLSVLDVGHGSCAVLHDEKGTVLDGGGSRQTLLRYLRDHELTNIDEIFVSHADADHIGGIIELLLNAPFLIRSVRVNPDVTKHSQVWKQLRAALNFKQGNVSPAVHPLIAQPLPEFNRGEAKIEVLAPTSEHWLNQFAGQTIEGKMITSNAMSSVVRITVNNVGKALLTADMSADTFNSLIGRGIDLKAEVLIFPHHGGLPSDADPTDFARRLCEAVDPKLIIFSIDRNKHLNPRPEVIAGVRLGAPNAHIACTQLSVRCAKKLPNIAPTHLTSVHAQGAVENRCCAGTIQLSLDSSPVTSSPSIAAHTEFVLLAAPDAMCKVDLKVIQDS